MNKAQKCALFNLIVTVVLLALHGSAFAIIATVGPVPKILNAAGFFVAFALIGVSALLYQRKQRLSEADFDERDRLISKRALAIAYISLWAIVIAGCIASWVVIGPAGVHSFLGCYRPGRDAVDTSLCFARFGLWRIYHHNAGAFVSCTDSVRLERKGRIL